MIQVVHSFTRNYGELRNRLITKCRVSAARSPEGKETASPVLEFDALWDTGATASVITEAVASALELVQEGSSRVFHAQGSAIVPIYFVNLGLPNGVTVEGVKVSQGSFLGCDVVIGMDIMNQCDFAMTNRNGKTVFSFQMPSVNHIDFVAMLEEQKR